MILAIDIGNTNIVLGAMEENQILFEARIATNSGKTDDQYCIEIKSMLELYKVDVNCLEATVIASVVPPVLNAVRRAVTRLCGCEPMVVGPGIKTGLNVRTDNPREVGSDMIVSSVAAIKEYGAPLLVVDMGTATTISALDRSGAFVGCCICPGVRISMDALTKGTAQLPGIGLDKPRHAIGRNTVDAMQSGIMFGAASMLDGLLERMEQELGEPVKVVATGGIAQAIVPLCQREMIYDGDLLLKGLALIYALNRKN